MTAIRVNNLSKRYTLGGVRHNSLRDALMGIFSRKGAGGETILALDDVSFELAEGETLGVIGRNGAGKSTLLKILSRITRPTSGTAEIRGRVGSLLEVGTGFHNELSGRENIYLNGVILGMRRSEIDRKFDEIVEFSGVERFLDTPVKHYSSGMYMRLAFSVAAHLEPEVLIVDEVLAVGDIEFQAKCLGKMDEVSRSGRTVLFVSHNLGSLAQICRRGLVLEKGRIVTLTDIHDATAEYLKLARSAKQFALEAATDAPMQIYEAAIVNSEGLVTSEIGHESEFFLEFSVRVAEIERGAMFCIAVLNKYRRRVFTVHQQLAELLPREKGDFGLRFRIPGEFLAPNDYSFLIQIFLPSGEVRQELFDICPFVIIDTGSELAAYRDFGYVQFKADWQVEEH